MKVLVKLFATFREGRFEQQQRDYAPGTSVGQVLDELDIPRAKLGFTLVNSRHVSEATPLQDGDTLAIFPLVGGG